MQFGEVWVEARELLGKPPDGDDEKENVEDNDEAHWAEEAPDESVLQGEPAAMREETHLRQQNRKQRVCVIH